MSLSKNLSLKIIESIEDIKNKSIEIANFIFNNPEVGKKEYKAKEILTRFLKENNFSVKEDIESLPTAFIGEYNFENSGPSVAFLAEYDALPGIGHACHHHIIASSSVCTAVALSKLNKYLAGKLYVIGTPAEENSDTKIKMIKQGIFNSVDVGIMLHGGPKNTTNLELYCLIGLEFIYTGKASHAASAPYEGINALDAILLLFNSINALRQQLPEGVKIHGIITEGGKVANIIPEKCKAKFYIRAKSKKLLNEVIIKVKNCAEGAKLQTGTKLKIIEFEGPLMNLNNNLTMANYYEFIFNSLGGKIENQPFLLGSSDIGNVSYTIPILNSMIKTANDNVCLHTKEFLESATLEETYNQMILGMKAMAITASRVLLDKNYFNKIKREFNLTKNNF